MITRKMKMNEDKSMVIESSSEVNNQDETSLLKIKSKYTLLKQEIDDYMDENPTNETCIYFADVDTCIDKITQMRTEFRTICIDLENTMPTAQYPTYSHEINDIMAAIKEYIINAKKRKSDIKRSEKYQTTTEDSLKRKKECEERAQKKRAAEFLIGEVSRITTELLNEFEKECNPDVIDEEILRRKDDLSTNILKLDQLSNKFQRCLEIIPEDLDDKEAVIDGLVKRYQDLIERKESYDAFITSEIKERELSKQKSFQVSSLNIKLSKFSGYDSDMDIYTFQREFDKLHLKNTPKRMLSDLLKYNYLKEPALSLVKSLESIDEMWNRLKKAYGDSNILLNKKLCTVQQIGPIWKIKDNERLQESLMALINGMKDLMCLAKYHKIEGKLYYGNGIDQIYKLMGDTRMTKWISISCDEELEGEELWNELIKFLEKDLRIQQELGNLKRKSINSDGRQSYCAAGDVSENQSYQDSCQESSHVAVTESQSVDQDKCLICNETGHYKVKGPNGNMIIQYFSCQKFVEMNPLDRFRELRKKGLCYMCLYPGAPQNSYKHSNGLCQRDFTCNHPSHDRYDRKKHVLVCHEHRNTEENRRILDEYKKTCILNRRDAPQFSKDIKLSFMTQQSFASTSRKTEAEVNDDSIITENGVYLLQRIQVEDQHYTVFFDSGCSDMVVRHDAILRLGGRAKQEIKGPMSLGGVGNMKVESKHGIYQIRLPLTNGKSAVLAGVCLDTITNTFPIYPIKGQLQDDIFKAYEENGGNIDSLPKLPDSIGGDVDIMIGSKYLRYHPEAIFSLPSGLTVFKSLLVGANGDQGIIGGPHPVITQVDHNHNKNKSCQYAYSSRQIFSTTLNDMLLSSNKIAEGLIKETVGENFCLCGENIEIDQQTEVKSCQSCNLVSPIEQKYFENIENAASEILYRCINCRKCQKCRNGERIEYISIKEEVEQDLINQSVKLDIDSGSSTAKLPFTSNPSVKLAPNRNKALAIYKSQVKKLDKDPIRKSDVMASEKKLQNLGYVDYVRNLPQEHQIMLKESAIQNFIPWSSVWKENSVSTPCRLVFNASLPTDTGTSLNDILAKGTNNMNVLVEIFIRWRSHQCAFHTDVQKMYNSVLLDKEYWCYQRYIWQESLDLCFIPEEKVIKTLIYGVKSSGNQAERALRMAADHFKEEYPDANNIVQQDTYVDDCMSGQNSLDDCFERADELTIVLMRGGFSLKGFTFSGHDPPSNLSEDKRSIHVAGMIWYPKADELSLDISPLDFSAKQRGKRTQTQLNIPETFTRRQCLSKVAEIFDLTGMITPITAAMKMDLHVLVQRKLNWDDTIPDDLRHVWLSHFDMMKELPSLKFNRAVIPKDAVSLELDTIDSGDSSKEMACVAIYARFLRKCGSYSCQLIFARSKLVPDGMSIPRAELLAANLNTHTGEVVKRSLRTIHKKSLKLTDSQVTMHWINNQELPLKQWTRNRVVEVLRFTSAKEWAYIKTTDMPADLGTRRGASLSDMSQTSAWQIGFEWMRKKPSEFPIKTYEQIKQSCKDASDASCELIKQPTSLQNNQVQVSSYFENRSKGYVADYLINPRKFRFRKVVRVMALVMMFIKRCKLKRQTPSTGKISNLNITDADYQEALNYFFRLASVEIKKNLKEEKYSKISHEKDGILYYSGRILPSQQINSITTMTDIMLDLTETTFCVPLVDKASPLAVSIANEIHWHHEIARHSGVETVLRYTMKYAYIIEGRELVLAIRKSCARCKLLLKRTLAVSMGPVSEYQLTIAPAFYVSQTDIVGPFKAYSPHNKRVTLKIWFVVFCCVATSSTSIKVMEDYGTSSFIQAFIRFSCDVGYPKTLLIDEGSQLIKGCETMLFDFRDTRYKLNQNMQVDFEMCPVGGHNFHGKVERKIRSIRESLEKVINQDRLSVLQWETLCAQLSNSLNNMPIALSKSTASLEYADILTPNRLKLGRNNDRSPAGPMKVTSDSSKIFQLNQKIFDTWFEAWLITYVPKLMLHPKWFDNDANIKIGDVVLFLKSEKELSNDYQYGMIVEVNKGRDGNIRSATVKYRNHTEKADRFTTRATRQLVVIHPSDELDLNELNYSALYVDMKFRMLHDQE